LKSLLGLGSRTLLKRASSPMDYDNNLDLGSNCA
jgi:hypothetical protein